MVDHVYVWHFAGTTLRDGSPLPPPGKALPEIPNVKMCRSGYHGSVNPLDALLYAPGPLVSRQRIWGNLLIADNKCVGSFREGITPYVDVAKIIMKFARKCALDVFHLWDAPEIVREYLTTGSPHLRKAARAAAWDAGWDAARAAAAAGGAAGAAAAAGGAAGAAGWAAAGDAAWATARAAAGARGVAGGAAWDAAWDDQARLLSRMLHEALAGHPFDPKIKEY